MLFGQQVFAEDGLNAFLLVHPLLCQSMCEPLEEERRERKPSESGGEREVEEGCKGVEGGQREGKREPLRVRQNRGKQKGNGEGGIS